MLTLERKDGEAIIIQHEGQELRINVRRARGDIFGLGASKAVLSGSSFAGDTPAEGSASTTEEMSSSMLSDMIAMGVFVATSMSSPSNIFRT